MSLTKQSINYLRQQYEFDDTTLRRIEIILSDQTFLKAQKLTPCPETKIYSEEEVMKKCLKFGIWLQECTTYTSDPANEKYFEYNEKPIGDDYNEVANEQVISEFQEYLKSKQS